MMTRALFGLGMCLAIVVGASEAAVLRVPSEYPTIQAGIDASADGDIVLVAPGRYSGAGNARLGIRKPITLLCEQGPLTCVIDSEGSLSNPGYGIGIGSDSEAHLIVDGFTVTGGYGFGGMAGAIDCGGNCSVEIRNCVISANTSYRGGGVRVDGNDRTRVTLSNCMITGNRCVGDRSIGGGVFCEAGSQAFIKGTDNRVVLRNCVVAGNQAAFGGGVACKEGTIRLENCIVTNNRAFPGKGHQVYIGNSNAGCSIVGCERGVIELVHSCFDEEIPVIYWDYEGDWGKRGWDIDFYSLGNIAADPVFAVPGYWDPNGTDDDPNDDFWVDGDYHLRSQAGRWDPNGGSWVQDDVTSPCIDAGDPNSPIGYGPFPNGGRINMGAYGGTAEASKSYFGEPVCETIIAGDINGDCVVDFKDLAILTRHWLEDRSRE